jgi:tetratricopeptide (TPR) repeat protein
MTVSKLRHSKSQLAIEYAYRARDQSPETWVFWIHASNAVRFEQSYRNIADSVKIAGRRNPSINIFELVHGWLRSSKRPWLLILDNVDDAGFLLEAQPHSNGQPRDSCTSPRRLLDYLPRSQNGSVLVTTRSKDAALQLVEARNIIVVEPLEREDALKLFDKKLAQADDLGEIAELAYTLEYMPLAIVQAAAYISQRVPRCSARQYLEEFRKSDREKTSLLDNEAGHLRRDREAKNSIILTWHISFDHIRRTRPSAANLLSLMSFFDRQGIPEALIRHRAENKESEDDKHKGQSQGFRRFSHLFRSKKEVYESHMRDKEKRDKSDTFNDDLVMLKNYSFISITGNSSIFEMHMLVQLATRKWLETDGQHEKWRCQFVKNLCEGLRTGEYENWECCQALFPHVKAAAQQRPKELAALRDWASIMYKAAWYTWRIGNGAETETLSLESMKARLKVFGSKHEETIASKAMLGSAYSLQGRWSAAEELEVQVMEMSKKKLGADHPDTLTSMGNLASTYRNQGRWSAAEELFVQVMEMSKKKFGADHPDTLTSMGNLASTYRNQGRWSAAEELEVQVMEMRKKKLGADHPDTLTSMNNLAFTWKGQGRDEEAIRLMNECILLRTHVLGAHHHLTVSSAEALIG